MISLAFYCRWLGVRKTCFCIRYIFLSSMLSLIKTFCLQIRFHTIECWHEMARLHPGNINSVHTWPPAIHRRSSEQHVIYRQIPLVAPKSSYGCLKISPPTGRVLPQILTVQGKPCWRRLPVDLQDWIPSTRLAAMSVFSHCTMLTVCLFQKYSLSFISIAS